MDQRYSIEREYCGYPELRWVVRFCGDWVGQALKYEEACAKRDEFERDREAMEARIDAAIARRERERKGQ